MPRRKESKKYLKNDKERVIFGLKLSLITVALIKLLPVFIELGRRIYNSD